MPKEGIFVRILRGGYIKPGDTIELVEEPETAELIYS
jgi:MOSC domain-containing protein YiiM